MHIHEIVERKYVLGQIAVGPEAGRDRTEGERI